MRTQYSPPALGQGWLLANLKDEFPSHLSSPQGITLLEDLIEAYTQWWRLMLTYPERRIVGTSALWFIRTVHARRMELFFSDCFEYLGKILSSEQIWKGELDFRGTHDTARSLKEMLDWHPIAWSPILRTAEALASTKIVRINE